MCSLLIFVAAAEFPFVHGTRAQKSEDDLSRLQAVSAVTSSGCRIVSGADCLGSCLIWFFLWWRVFYYVPSTSSFSLS